MEPRRIKGRQSAGGNAESERSVRVHRAAWILADSETLIHNGFVLTVGGVIVSVGEGKGASGAPVTDHGDGILMPPLVNAHTHLELSALKHPDGMYPQFSDWVRWVLRSREAAGPEQLRREAANAVRGLLDFGSPVIGEVSTLGITADLFEKSNLSGVWFHEGIGGAVPDTECRRLDIHKSVSLAGHAPHTTHPKVLRRLKEITGKARLPFAIHLAESRDEMDFIAHGSGAWADFLTERQVDFRDWPLGGVSAVEYADRMGLLDAGTLAVHLIHTGKKDLEILANKNVTPCLCPRSNLRLHHRLPDADGMLSAGLHPCLGTDSLASVDSLSIFEEMRFLGGQPESPSPKRILEMATVNGARALGVSESFGTLIPGRKAVLLYVEMPGADRETLIENLVHEGARAKCRLIWNEEQCKKDEPL